MRGDPFDCQGNLLKLSRELEEAGLPSGEQRVLQINRSDYMLDHPSGRMLQVPLSCSPASSASALPRLTSPGLCRWSSTPSRPPSDASATSLGTCTAM